MSPRRPSNTDEGKAGDPAKEPTDAQEAKEAAAVEAASQEAPKPKARRRRKKATPEAEGTAAEATGVDKAAAEAALEAPVEEEPAAEAEPEPEPEAKPAKAAAKSKAKAADTAEAEAEAEAEPEPEPVAEEKPKPPRRTRRRAEDDKPAAPAAKPKRGARDYGDTPPMVRAHAKYVRTSARKARLVCDHIRGKSVPEARAILAHASRDVARDWSKLLESAVANAEHNHELIGDELRIHAVKADEGPTLKRFRPRAMGRATKIRKRTSHLSITLTPRDGEY
jgi:ribosomal protein L22